AATMANDLVVVEPVLVQKIAEDKDAAARILQLIEQNTLNNTALDSDVLSDNNTTQVLNSNNNLTTNVTTTAKTMPNFKQSMDANIQQLTSRIAQDWQQANHKPSNIAQTEAVPEKRQMVTAHSLQVGDIIMVEAGSEIISDGILLSST